MFSTHCSLGLTWSDDLVTWDWPGKKAVDISSLKTKEIKVKAPFGDVVISEPLFADRIFDIRDYGAVSDGVTKNTKAFADAIEACSEAGGGKVVVPSGTWFTGPVHLRSNVNLHLKDGAVLLFSDDLNDYLPAVFSRYEGVECYLFSPPIYARDGQNIAITGRGRLEGHWQKWWGMFRQKGKGQMQGLLKKAYEKVPVKNRIYDSIERFLRPSFVQFINCKNILVEGITIGSGPMWTLHPVYCEDVIVRDVTFITKGPNNDGIDPDSSKDVLIENCRFDTDDDAIAIKSGRDEDGRNVGRPCENIVIRNCLFGLGTKCDGVVSIGSEMSGDVRNVFIYDCKFDKTGRGIRIKSKRGRGGVVENIWIENITLGSVGSDALLLNTFYGSGSESWSKAPPLFRNIHAKNITCGKAREAIKITGLPEMPVENVTLENITVASGKGITCTDAKGIKIVNVNIKPQQGPIISLNNCSDVKITGSSCPLNIDTYVKLEGQKTSGIVLKDNNLTDTQKEIVLGQGVSPYAIAR
ncbi:MAG: glycoside hydrolase family 28 protein, partial [Planctomycetota bacterium]